MASSFQRGSSAPTSSRPSSEIVPTGVAVHCEVGEPVTDVELEDSDLDDEEAVQVDEPSSLEKRKRTHAELCRTVHPLMEDFGDRKGPKRKQEEQKSKKSKVSKELALPGQLTSADESLKDFIERMKHHHLAWECELKIDITKIDQAQFGLDGQASRPLDENFVQGIANSIWENGLIYQPPLELLLVKNDDIRTSDASKFQPAVLEAFPDLRFIVFAHQHQCQALKTVHSWTTTRNDEAAAVTEKDVATVRAHIWVGLNDHDVVKLGQIHNDVDHHLKLRSTWDLVNLLRVSWKKNGAYFPRTFSCFQTFSIFLHFILLTFFSFFFYSR